MIEPRRTLRPEYFDAIYATDADPWKFSTSAYEKEKYALTLKALPKRHYDRAFEVGCSIGVLTRELGSRCKALLAVDAAAAPITEAMQRCADQPHIDFRQLYVPRDWPNETFDLIVLSEVVYYLDDADVTKLATMASGALAPGGDIVLVHWTGMTNYPLSGDEAAELFIKAVDPAVQIVSGKRYDRFRIDALSRQFR